MPLVIDGNVVAVANSSALPKLCARDLRELVVLLGEPNHGGGVVLECHKQRVDTCGHGDQAHGPARAAAAVLVFPENRSLARIDPKELLVTRRHDLRTTEERERDWRLILNPVLADGPKALAACGIKAGYGAHLGTNLNDQCAIAHQRR